MYIFVYLYIFYSWHRSLLKGKIPFLKSMTTIDSQLNLVYICLYDIQCRSGSWRLWTVRADDKSRWATPKSWSHLKKKAKRIRPFCFIFFHDFHGVFHGAHMRRRVWRLTATKIWPTTGNITAWQENVTWFDKRKLWRLETKHYVFPTKHNDDVLHMLNKRNVHFDHNNGWFVHFDQNFGWSANQVWLWIHLVMPLDVDAESLPTFQLFHDEESNIVQHFFQTWYILKYLEIYFENTIFDSKTCFLFVFFRFLVFDSVTSRAGPGLGSSDARRARRSRSQRKNMHTPSRLWLHLGSQDVLRF